MARAPIPQRIPPLMWRRPAFLWTPVALALAIGAPTAVFYDDPGVQRAMFLAGVSVFTAALLILGVAWAVGRAPRTRRDVVACVVTVGALAAFAAPFAMTELLAAIAPERPSLAMAMAMTPLALLIGLPSALLAGVVFAWTALKRKDLDGDKLLDDAVFRHDVQPFR